MEELEKNMAVIRAMNAQAAELCVLRLLVMALAKQSPDAKALLAGFSDLSEKQVVRAMYSERSEKFYESVESFGEDWRKYLQAL